MGRGRSLVLVLWLAGCAQAPQGHALGLLEFRQAGVESVALNEDLLFYFDADLDRASISSDSVHIVDEQGLEVSGERTVRGDALIFQPTLPCRSDLSDGGLRPDETYRVVLGGFPRPDGIRSEAGALLSATLVFSFKTAAPGDTNPLFLRPVTPPAPLRPRARTLPDHFELDEGWILLECDEALDPSSVQHAVFELTYYPKPAHPEVIPLTVRLVVNRRDHAELLLEPAGASDLGGERLGPGDYYLRLAQKDLRDLGGNQIELGWPLKWWLRVRAPRFELDFTSLSERAGEVPPSCAGSATWEAGSGLRLRYPAAAGRGDAGDVELSGALNTADLHATQILLPARTDLDASGLPGPVVLRSQTSIEIRGRLLRRGEFHPQTGNALNDMLVDAPPLQRERWPTLSDWLSSLLATDQRWTVLIAGGDILIPRGGSIEVDGPLVLVAGGRIRTEGSNVITQSDLWKNPQEGGGGAARGHLRLLPLNLDPPERNPLRKILVVGALTREFPWVTRPGRWRSTLLGHAGDGRLSVHYLQAPPGSEIERWVSDPGELVTGPARALVRLEIGPGHGEAWDPPRLERVELQAGQLLSTEEVRESGEVEPETPR